jgi:hypothetical protein
MLSDSACAADRLESSCGTKKSYHAKMFLGNQHNLHENVSKFRQKFYRGIAIKI